MTATYDHDFADRETSLSVTTAEGTTPVVTSAAYLPSGPLTALAFGTGAVETRTFTARYFPATIALDAAQDRTWSYTTDVVGNILRIEEVPVCPGDLLLSNATVTGTETHQSCAAIEAGPSYTVGYAVNNPLIFMDPLGLKVVVENPETAERYETLKECFPLFRSVAEHFESDAWTIFGPERTWTIKDPDWQPGSCAVGGRNSEPRTIWVPPDRDCRGAMRCLFHEFYELWLIRAGGFPPSKMATGPADERAREFEAHIPFERCCPCD